MREVGAIVLAGGKSSRMGENKALMRIGELRFLDRVMNAVKALTTDVIVSGDPEIFEALGYQTIPDIIAGAGPAGGIYTGLANTEREINLVLSCDIPFIRKDLLSDMIASYTDEDALICRQGDQSHPLIAIYNRRCAPKILDSINSGIYKMSDILSKLDVLQFEVRGSMRDQLININDKKELMKYAD